MGTHDAQLDLRAALANPYLAVGLRRIAAGESFERVAREMEIDATYRGRSLERFGQARTAYQTLLRIAH